MTSIVSESLESLERERLIKLLNEQHQLADEKMDDVESSLFQGLENELDVPNISNRMATFLWDGTPEMRRLILSKWFHKRDGRTIITPTIGRVGLGIPNDVPNEIDALITAHCKYVENGGYRNRNANAGLIARFKQSIEDNNWHLNGVSINFSNTWDITDSHHRLFSVVLAGVPIKSCYSTRLDNTDHAAWNTTDIGGPRTTKHALEHLGVPVPSETSLVVDLLYKHESTQHVLDNRTNEGIKYKHDVLKEYVNKYPLIEESIHYLNNLSYSRKHKYQDLRYYVTKKPGLFSFIVFATAEKKVRGNYDLTKEFFNGIHSGVNLMQNSPITRFRQLIEGKKRVNMKIKLDLVLHHIGKTFSLWLEEKECIQLRANKVHTFPKMDEIEKWFEKTNRKPSLTV